MLEVDEEMQLDGRGDREGNMLKIRCMECRDGVMIRELGETSLYGNSGASWRPGTMEAARRIWGDLC